MSSGLQRWLPFLQWWPRVGRASLRADLIAGLTGSLILVPQGVAFATIAGMPPEYGLYAAMLPAIVADRAAPLRRLLEAASAGGATTSVDLAVVDPTSAVGGLDWHAILEAIAPATDVLTPSLDDLTSALAITETFSLELIDRLSRWLINAGVGVVAISAGRHGLFVRTAGAARLAAGGSALAAVSREWADHELQWAPVAVETVVTTNGAGDAASAGLLYALAAGASVEAAGLLATAAAAVAAAPAT
jgi:MFS superfamily sulfate permease-like transporter